MCSFRCDSSLLKKKTNFKPFVLRLSCTFIFNFNYRFHSILWVLSNATFGFHITSSRDNKNEIVSHLSGNQTIESKLLENVQQLFEFETSSSSLAHQSTYYRIAWRDVESNEQHYFAISLYVCALKILFGLALLVLSLSLFFGILKPVQNQILPKYGYFWCYYESFSNIGSMLNIICDVHAIERLLTLMLRLSSQLTSFLLAVATLFIDEVHLYACWLDFMTNYISLSTHCYCR